LVGGLGIQTGSEGSIRDIIKGGPYRWPVLASVPRMALEGLKISETSPSRRALEMACLGKGSKDGRSPALSLVVLGF
jgi:hypothetical protein